ncbi:hypothetical protein A3A60_01005 [Candidatus Curtissbacteria bacterium RIFCSPLOWO2_01_FULL_42_26]|uniref:Type II secretion system protein GspH n=1 Tax=Candidatus Curtissbacteria bacterium RIFCSPLOWO2_01_FULL_42_26 TaxID=1797729 RepID=A0A1F5HXT3_9BACT|nr:MAG: hypothetical protein A3A60_01005 [Candidatus Curtissbacteria bacterium RIFCSPLOWO2_01_FULL_42_26]
MDTLRKFQISFSHRNSLKASSFKFQIEKAYTLIELMIVVTVIGLAVGLITTSYLGFERRQRVKNTALEIKNNIRLAQNNAHSGNKGFGPDKCDTEKEEILVGWYASFNKDLQTYSVSGDCKDKSGAEREFGRQRFRLPQDVSISAIDAGNQVNVLYRPLTENATFHSTTDFLDNTGKLQNLISAGQVTIDLAGPTPYKYQVIILPTGEVNEKQL